MSRSNLSMTENIFSQYKVQVNNQISMSPKQRTQNNVEQLVRKNMEHGINNNGNYPEHLIKLN